MENENLNKKLGELLFPFLGFMTITLLLLSSKYEVIITWNSLNDKIIIWLIFVVFYGIFFLIKLKSRLHPWLLRLLSIIFGGFSLLSVKAMIIVYLHQDIVLKKAWILIKRNYSMEERIKIGRKWAEEASVELTNSSCSLSEETVIKLAENSILMSDLKRNIIHETVNLYWQYKKETEYGGVLSYLDFLYESCGFIFVFIEDSPLLSIGSMFSIVILYQMFRNF